MWGSGDPTPRAGAPGPAPGDPGRRLGDEGRGLTVQLRPTGRLRAAVRVERAPGTRGDDKPRSGPAPRRPPGEQGQGDAASRLACSSEQRTERPWSGKGYLQGRHRDRQVSRKHPETPGNACKQSSPRGYRLIDILGSSKRTFRAGKGKPWLRSRRRLGIFRG